MFNSLSVLDVNCGYEPEEPLEMRFYSLLTLRLSAATAAIFVLCLFHSFFFPSINTPFFYFFLGGGCFVVWTGGNVILV
jgi:hypothetical protein